MVGNVDYSPPSSLLAWDPFIARPLPLLPSTHLSSIFTPVYNLYLMTL